MATAIRSRDPFETLSDFGLAPLSVAQEDITAVSDSEGTPMYGSYFGCFTLRGAAKRYGVGYTVIRDLTVKLDLARTRVGRSRLISPTEIPFLEAGLKALGHRVPTDLPPVTEEQEVASSSR
jgi:hypothetical protein